MLRKRNRYSWMAVVVATACCGSVAASPGHAEACSACMRAGDSGTFTTMFHARRVRGGVATFRLRRLAPERIVSARLGGPRRRKLSLGHVRAAARRGTLKVRVARRGAPAWRARTKRRLRLQVVSQRRKGRTPAPAPPPGAGVSGSAMPVGDLPGWRLAWSDDFPGLALDRTKWDSPYSDGDRWRPWHAAVANGMLTIDAYPDPAVGNKWVSTGVFARSHQTYGKYVVRFRFDAGKGISTALMVWPSGCWPWEIDFAETGGSDTTRDSMWAFQHYQGPGGCGDDRQHVGGRVSADFTQWHEIGVEWSPGRLDYTLDGRVWSSLTNGQVPTTPGHLVLQTEACNPTCPDSSTPAHVRLQVDWVVVYARR